jgi:hypothetical protein
VHLLNAAKHRELGCGGACRDSGCVLCFRFRVASLIFQQEWLPQELADVVSEYVSRKRSRCYFCWQDEYDDTMVPVHCSRNENAPRLGCATCVRGWVSDKISKNRVYVTVQQAGSFAQVFHPDDITTIRNVLSACSSPTSLPLRFERFISGVDAMPDIVACPTKDCPFVGFRSSLFTDLNRDSSLTDFKRDGLVVPVTETAKFETRIRMPESYGTITPRSVKLQDSARCELCGKCWKLPTIQGPTEDFRTRFWKWMFTKPCPGCGTKTFKDEGCTHMFCEVCRVNWCWKCGWKSTCPCYDRHHPSYGTTRPNIFTSSRHHWSMWRARNGTGSCILNAGWQALGIAAILGTITYAIILTR